MSGVDSVTAVFYSAEAILLAGFGYAAWEDWRRREVADGLWVVLGLAGSALGFVLLAGDGPVALGLWLLVALFVLQHFLPWDTWAEHRSPVLPAIVEGTTYGGTTAILVIAGVVFRIGPTGLPVPVIAVFASVLLARGLFEARILYGGADAKALMAAALLLPLVTAPWISPSTPAASVLGILPFAFTILTNAALLAIAVPFAIAIRNARNHEFEFPRGFVGYFIPVRELPARYVWVRDPTFAIGAEEDVETSEDDVRLRERQKADLESRGVTRVWVTPQLPFLVLLALGALAGLLYGNLLFDIITAA